MIAPARIALLKDSYYQVMDNWVFRILAVLCAIFVLIPFVIGLREEGVVIGFGIVEWSYEDILGRLGQAGQPGDLRTQAISFYMEYVVQMAAGNIGVLFSIAATSFFVPQMLEKGAADVLFHKPLGRLSFYMSRYFAGVLFVALLSSVLALGNYFGFLLASGHNDPGILMGAPLMTYIFAAIFSVSMLIGVVTRSTVAAILLTCIFFFLNGCVDMAWKGGTEFELQMANSGAAEIMASAKRVDRKLEAEDSGKSEASDEDAGLEDEAEEEEDHLILDTLWNIVCGFHYVLPKTGDADVIAKKLRRVISAPPFREDSSRLSLLHIPEGMQLLEADTGRAPREFTEEEAGLLGEVRFLLETTADEHKLRYTLFRRESVKSERTRKGRVITSIESSTKASKQLRALLQTRVREQAGPDEESAPDVSRKSKSFRRPGLGSVSGFLLGWNTSTGTGRQAMVFRVGEDWVYTLVIEDASPEQSEERAAEVLHRVGKDLAYDDSVAAFQEAFTLDAPWRFNIWFSVGSTLLFTLLMLMIGYWRVTRIDF